MGYDIRNIFVFQKAHQFVLDVYRCTRDFPEFEKYGLSSQFQRAAVSIPANIAEGSKKISKADKLRFMNISQGSLEECRYYILLSKDLKYISEESYYSMTAEIEEVSKLLNAFVQGIINHNYSSVL
jgi:four helix bundle protein